MLSSTIHQPNCNFITMKKIIILLTIFVLYSLSVFSQNEMEYFKQPYKKSEFIFSVGAFPIVGIFTSDPNTIKGYSPIVERTMSHYYHLTNRQDTFQAIVIGSFNFVYLKNLNKFSAIGLSYSFAMRDAYISINRPAVYSIMDYSPAVYLNYRQYEIYNILQFAYRQTCYRTNHFFVYFSTYLGLTFGYAHPYQVLRGDFSSRFWILPNIHLNFLGIAFGEKFPVHIEFGLGNQGLIKAGVRF